MFNYSQESNDRSAMHLDLLRQTRATLLVSERVLSLMGEGFILLTRGYGFMGGVYHPPFDTSKIGTSTDDIKLKLYR